MAFTNTVSVYNRYSSTGQIPILKSDMTKLTRDLSNMQQYFATDSTGNAGRFQQLLLAYQGTNVEATATPATNIALRHLKNATLIGSGTYIASSSSYGALLSYVIGTIATVGCRGYINLVSSSYSYSHTSIYNKYAHFGILQLTSATGGANLLFRFGTFIDDYVSSAAMATNAITLTRVFGMYVGKHDSIRVLSTAAWNETFTNAASPGAMYFIYKFYSCDIED